MELHWLASFYICVFFFKILLKGSGRGSQFQWGKKLRSPLLRIFSMTFSFHIHVYAYTESTSLWKVSSYFKMCESICESRSVIDAIVWGKKCRITDTGKTGLKLGDCVQKYLYDISQNAYSVSFLNHFNGSRRTDKPDSRVTDLKQCCSDHRRRLTLGTSSWRDLVHWNHMDWTGKFSYT